MVFRTFLFLYLYSGLRDQVSTSGQRWFAWNDTLLQGCHVCEDEGQVSRSVWLWKNVVAGTEGQLRMSVQETHMLVISIK